MAGYKRHPGRPARRRYDVQPLVRARDEQGLTDSDIARFLRLDPSTVCRTLAGHPSYQGPKTVKAIADFLRVPMAELIPTPEAVA